MRSMTGYGKGSCEEDGLRATVEMRGVNQKGLDLHFRMPPALWFAEPACRERLRTCVSRGRVDLAVALDFLAPDALSVTISEGMMRGVGDAAGALVAEGKLARGMTFSDLLALPDALRIGLPEERRGAASRCLLIALDEALEGFLASSGQEGERLLGQFKDGAARAGALLASARPMKEAHLFQTRERLAARAGEMGIAVDPGRMEQEVALAAERADVEEEIVRLEAHAGALGKLLSESPIDLGKRLDHLLQEMQREVSTLLAKSNLLELTRVGMDLRLLVEQLREQAQNVA